MAKENSHGRTRTSRPITGELVEALAAKAEVGYDVDETIRRRGGRPAMGSAAAGVESADLTPSFAARSLIAPNRMAKPCPP